ncbi:hypothetical protein CFP56_036580 [Quercus suber]|uniref:Uncharacterized protein n=1 Tax=Quercus suber TaxID=58331 RepID=A0AAW0J6H7_QUESU
MADQNAALAKPIWMKQKQSVVDQARFIVRPSLKSINSPHEPPKPVSVPEAFNKLRGETIEVNEESLDSVLKIA